MPANSKKNFLQERQKQLKAGWSCKHTYMALLAGWGLMLFILPQLSLTLIWVNLLFMFAITGLQFYSALIPSKKLQAEIIDAEPFVSIHIPTYNEPPELVILTLKALEKLHYENYEVIVLDNNTEDPQVWKPVEKACQALGERFRFKHVDKLQGFKAGALNLCKEMSHPATEFILVIDADYRVQPELLQEALGHFAEDKVGLVQFPQAYVNTSPANRGMQSEYDHFFEVYMNMANQLNCVLSTGTVSVIRKEALEAVGGWSSSTITEDCELGLRLHQKGYRGVYVPKSLGKGLMPTDLASLKIQRERWVFGNMQTLSSFLRLPKDKLSLTQCAGIITQLTAWFNFLLLPVIGALSGALGLLLTGQQAYHSILSFSLLSIWLFLLGKFIFFRLVFRHRKHALEHTVDAYLVHLGMAWEGAFSWVRCLCGENIRFKRTNKFLNLGKTRHLNANLLFTAMLTLSGIIAFGTGYYSEGGLAFLAAPAFASVFFLRRLTRHTYVLTQTLQDAKAA